MKPAIAIIGDRFMLPSTFETAIRRKYRGEFPSWSCRNSCFGPTSFCGRTNRFAVLFPRKFRCVCGLQSLRSLLKTCTKTFVRNHY